MAHVPISSPRFGGCKDPNNDDSISKCAFYPSDCGSPSNYVKAHEIEGNQCTHPAQVTIGRCSSSVDKNICAVSSDACEIAAKFESFDSECNIVEAHYPSCNYDGRCVVSKGDCEDDEIFYQVAHLRWTDPCFCDKVPTGICYMDAVSPITSDSSFCAVGLHDCPDGYSFLKANDLLTMDSKEKPRTCNLCRQVDVTEAGMLHEQVVESGGCFSSFENKFLNCALESSACPTNANYKSPIEMRALDLVPCPADEITTGKCTSTLDQIECTSHPSACFLPEKFVSSESCTVHSNVDNQDPTFYGMCRQNSAEGGNWREHRCTWQKSECEERIEIWWHARQPVNTWLEACHCEHVETGACEYVDGQDTKYYCAVSSKGCSDPSSYRTSFEMNAIGHKCMLCQPKRDRGAEPTPFPTTVGHGNILGNNGKIPNQPSASPTVSNQTPPPSLSRTSDKTDESNSADLLSHSEKDDEVILVSIFVPLILLIVAALVIPRFLCRSQTEQAEPAVVDNLEDQALPAEEHSLS